VQPEAEAVAVLGAAPAVAAELQQAAVARDVAARRRAVAVPQAGALQAALPLVPAAAASAPASSVPEDPSHHRQAQVPARRRCCALARQQRRASARCWRSQLSPKAGGEFWSWISF
jgi:hypothetical protein